MIYNSEEDKGNFVNFVYLHGKVQDYFNNDLMATDEELPLGIYEIEVNHYPNSCTAYVWKFEKEYIKGFYIYRGRGLIVDSNDKEANEYALTKYNEKSIIL